LDVITGKYIAKHAAVRRGNSDSRRRIEVNSLNVFPVPDGDTGTNMSSNAQCSVKRGRESGVQSEVNRITAALARGFAHGCEGKQRRYFVSVF
jgi:dihydroxyacetone kinase-like predicted kinase